MRVHIFKSKTRLVKFLMTEHVDLMVELSQLTCLIINDYIYDSVKNQDIYVQYENGLHGKKYLTFKLWGLMKNKYYIRNDHMHFSFISDI